MISFFKKIAFVLSLLFLSFGIRAQKIGVVDTRYILEKFPQYKEAEKRLETQVQTWQTEISQMQTNYEAKKTSFENEKVLLVGEQLKTREKEVLDLEKELKGLISKRFGTDGEVNKLRTSLTKPFQDQIWNAIKQVSDKNGLGIVLDKGNDANILFTDKKYDYTDKVLDILLKNQKK
ncbi:OmpH family outer membrane protein [Riemerella anatipestifer]|uniref:OmpH family outer membrane protein n=1 Tax=Riemerella anatipestifer TaxID=34085 RepID=UPI00129E24E3|nr:OmpH family outer membrane protein [Riemerella anatipestifer]MRM96287.1 OmpH family outer membrane protein [Riemerella anatipestifer]MRN00497.1 OmpH family outer membrane protein [Riemerella anatipestifer]MRN02495.1 OmpH family outer membrane protein [Riemerella anatipestifer]